MKNLKCAVVGLGVGEQHAKKYIEHPSTSLVSIVDFDDKKIKKFNSKLEQRIPKNTFEEIIEDPNIDMVSIASFDDNHYEQVIQCLGHNKHVFVEKPLCQTKEQLAVIHRKFIEASSSLYSNLILRKSPLFILLHKMILNGDFGEIYAFDADYLYGRVHKIIDGWRSKVDDYCVMEGGGIHLIDLMLKITREKPYEVHSSTNKIITNKTSFRYHDYQTSTFHFRSGLIGRISANFGCVHGHQHVVRVFGSKATFIYDDMGARIHWSRDNESKKIQYLKIPVKPSTKGDLLLDFIDSIISNKSRVLSNVEFDLMDVVLAAKASANNDVPEEIEYISKEGLDCLEQTL